MELSSCLRSRTTVSTIVIQVPHYPPHSSERLGAFTLTSLKEPRERQATDCKVLFMVNAAEIAEIAENATFKSLNQHILVIPIADISWEIRQAFGWP